jgi:hypothetical protein
MSMITRPNSWVASETGTSIQLTYGLQVNPAPITVSIPNQNPVLASLEFVLTNPTSKALSIQSVEFTIKVGPGASLTPSTDGIKTRVSDSVNWDVEPPQSRITDGNAVYKLQPATGTSVTLAGGASIVVQLFQIQTNTEPGNTKILIKETVVGSAPAFTSFEVTTFPSGFYFNGLAATIRRGSELVPVAQVPAGSPVTLVWNSSVVDVVAFRIYFSDASHGQQQATPADIGEWTTQPLTSDTIFTVVVTVRVAGGEPLTASMSTAVSVQNPNLVAASIIASEATVNGQVKAESAKITAGLTAKNATVDSLGVGTPTPENLLQVGSGTSTILRARVNAVIASETQHAGIAIAQKNTPPKDSVNVLLQASGAGGYIGTTSNHPLVLRTSDADRVSIDKDGNVSMSGTLTANSATVTSAFKATGSSSVFKSGMVPLTPGQGAWKIYKTFTDGFVIGYVGFPNSVTDGCMCWAWYGDTKGLSFATTGGNVGFFGRSWSKQMAHNPNMLMVPVAMGDSFGIQIQQGTTDQQSNAPYWFFWVPLGNAPAPQLTSGLDVKLPEVPKMVTGGLAPEEEDPCTEFVTLLAGVINKLEIDDKTKAKLIVALRKL